MCDIPKVYVLHELNVVSCSMSRLVLVLMNALSKRPLSSFIPYRAGALEPQEFNDVNDRLAWAIKNRDMVGFPYTPWRTSPNRWRASNRPASPARQRAVAAVRHIPSIGDRVNSYKEVSHSNCKTSEGEGE